MSFLTLIGLPDQQVLAASNTNRKEAQQLIRRGAKFHGYPYTEKIVWRYAARGKILSKSDFSAMSPEIRVTPVIADS
jgi:hypothetical protein